MTKQSCPECDATIWQNPAIPYLICPQCWCKLPEQSSEDADEGEMQAKGGFSHVSELLSIKIGDTLIFNTGDRRKVLAFNERNGYDCLIVDKELGVRHDICSFKLSDGKHPTLTDCMFWIVKVIAKEVTE